MLGITTNPALRKWLISIINSIGREVGLREEDKVLMVIQLDTEAKIDEFCKWLKTKMANEKFIATPQEVMHITAPIGKVKTE